MDFSKIYKIKRKKAIGLSKDEWDLLKRDSNKLESEKDIKTESGVKND